MKITKDTTIGDIVDNFDGSKEILSNYGMHCFGCPMSRMETLEEASMVHGVEVEELIHMLNEGTTEMTEDEKKLAQMDVDDTDYIDGEE